MQCLIKTILLNCMLFQAFCIITTQAQNVANLFFGSSLATQNPVISMSCFSDYILKSREISEGYSQDYNKCLLEAKADRQATDDHMLDKRLAIGERSQDICQRLSTCDSLNTTLEVFHCHALIGANNTKDVYRISGNASEYASVLQENYRQIDLRHEQCCKIAERVYVEATGVNYRQLQSCLEGLIEPSLTTTTTPATISNTPHDTLTRNITEIETNTENFETTSLQSAEVGNPTI